MQSRVHDEKFENLSFLSLVFTSIPATPAFASGLQIRSSSTYDTLVFSPIEPTAVRFVFRLNLSELETL